MPYVSITLFVPDEYYNFLISPDDTLQLVMANYIKNSVEIIKNPESKKSKISLIISEMNDNFTANMVRNAYVKRYGENISRVTIATTLAEFMDGGRISRIDHGIYRSINT